MKRLLQSTAIVIAAAAIVAWIGAGANRGWTKTSVPVKVIDEVTGIEGVTYKKQFVPGIDLLAVALAAAAVLGGSSFLFAKQKTQ